MEVCKLSAREVAKVWMDSESLYYRTVFGNGSETRLTAVIQRARNDGMQIGAVKFWQWLLVGLMGTGVGSAATVLFLVTH